MDKQREMFEEWWQQNRQCDDEDYHPAMRHYAWQAWQAAIATVKDSLTVQYEPVAWAVFADNGNSRVWFREKKYADQWIVNHGGASDVLTTLYVRTEPAK